MFRSYNRSLERARCTDRTQKQTVFISICSFPKTLVMSAPPLGLRRAMFWTNKLFLLFSYLFSHLRQMYKPFGFSILIGTSTPLLEHSSMDEEDGRTRIYWYWCSCRKTSNTPAPTSETEKAMRATSLFSTKAMRLAAICPTPQPSRFAILEVSCSIDHVSCISNGELRSAVSISPVRQQWNPFLMARSATASLIDCWFSVYPRPYYWESLRCSLYVFFGFKMRDVLWPQSLVSHMCFYDEQDCCEWVLYKFQQQVQGISPGAVYQRTLFSRSLPAILLSVKGAFLTNSTSFQYPSIIESTSDLPETRSTHCRTTGPTYG